MGKEGKGRGVLIDPPCVDMIVEVLAVALVRELGGGIVVSAAPIVIRTESVKKVFVLKTMFSRP